MKKILQKGISNPVRLVKEILTDMSPVYNVEIGRPECHVTEVLCRDEDQAQRLFNLLEECSSIVEF